MTNVKLSTTDLAKLEEVQSHVLESAAEDLKQWNELHNDYQKLKSCLESLSEKMAYDTMVPIGSIALLPVKLIHTNEIMVLLGDNWFTQCSSTQAVSILKRRIQFVEENMMLHSKANQRNTDKLSIIKKIQSEQEVSDTFEIQEPIEDDSDLQTGGSRIAHTPRHSLVPRSIKELDKQREKGVNLTQNNTIDETLWQRLDRLKIEESTEETQDVDKENQLDSDDDEDDEEVDCNEQPEERVTTQHQSTTIKDPTGDSVTNAEEPSRRPMSRFKASRQNR